MGENNALQVKCTVVLYPMHLDGNPVKPNDPVDHSTPRVMEATTTVLDMQKSRPSCQTSKCTYHLRCLCRTVSHCSNVSSTPSDNCKSWVHFFGVCPPEHGHLSCCLLISANSNAVVSCTIAGDDSPQDSEKTLLILIEVEPSSNTPQDGNK